MIVGTFEAPVLCSCAGNLEWACFDMIRTLDLEVPTFLQPEFLVPPQEQGHWMCWSARTNVSFQYNTPVRDATVRSPNIESKDDLAMSAIVCCTR